MQKLLKELNIVFIPREKIQIVLIFFLLLMGSFMEVIGIGVIFPFINIMIEPGKIQQNAYLSAIYNYLNMSSAIEFLIAGCFGLIAVYILKNTFLAVSQYIQLRFAFGRNTRIGTDLFFGYLKNPYTFHLQRNTAELIRNATGEISNFLMLFFFPGLIFISEMLIIIITVAFLIWIDWQMTFLAFSLMLLVGLVFYRFVHKKLKSAGENRQVFANKTNQQLMQGLGGIKETKILGRESFFSKTYQNFASQVNSSDLLIVISQHIPRFVLETAIITVMMGLTIFFLWNNRNPQEIVAVLSVFGLSGVRLLPSMTRVMNSLAAVRAGLPSLHVLAKDIEFNLNSRLKNMNELVAMNFENFSSFNKAMVLKNISYAYPDTTEHSIKNLSLEIKRGQSIGFVGSSGAGKTTIIDIILGLLEPTQGKILVDGQNLSEILPLWQKKIGYIPQSIFLSDETIRENIAFGLFEMEIDDEKVAQAVKLANLDVFINGLDKGIYTVVGERGVRLSGGQRQRIGIARALYHNPDILIMDEATAALDNETERAIVSSIDKLAGEKTIIMIAHRLSTIQHCDQIFFMANGRIIDSGTYKELLKKNKEFQSLAKNKNM